MRSPGHNSVVDRQKNALMPKETEQGETALWMSCLLHRTRSLDNRAIAPQAAPEVACFQEFFARVSGFVPGIPWKTWPRDRDLH